MSHSNNSRRGSYGSSHVNVEVKAEARRGRRRAAKRALDAVRTGRADAGDAVFADRNREVSNPFSWD